MWATNAAQLAAAVPAFTAATPAVAHHVQRLFLPPCFLFCSARFLNQAPKLPAQIACRHRRAKSMMLPARCTQAAESSRFWGQAGAREVFAHKNDNMKLFMLRKSTPDTSPTDRDG